jgi:hypothetical protein
MYKFYSLSYLLNTLNRTKLKKLLKTFKCSLNKDIEFFLHRNALLFEQKQRSKTYIYLNIDTMEVAGYFTIGISCIDVESFSISTLQKIYDKNHISKKCLPCYIIGQLGKSDKYKKVKGTTLLKKSIEIIQEANKLLNSKIIVLDSINYKKVIEFYKEYGFFELEEILVSKESIKMYILM